MKSIILTENKLRRLVTEAVKRILSENEDGFYGDEEQLEMEEPQAPNYGVTSLRASAEEVKEMIQQDGGFSQPDYYTSLYGKGVIIMAGPNIDKIKTYGETRITIDMDKLLSSGVKVKKVDDYEYKLRNGGMWQCLAQFVPADCIVDIQ